MGCGVSCPLTHHFLEKVERPLFKLGIHNFAIEQEYLFCCSNTKLVIYDMVAKRFVGRVIQLPSMGNILAIKCINCTGVSGLLFFNDEYELFDYSYKYSKREGGVTCSRSDN